MSSNPALPAYTDPALRTALLAAGASGTIYALVMPETEAALQRVVDGYRPETMPGDRERRVLLRERAWLDLYREPWTQKQDAMHEAYFAQWLEWSAPVVRFAADSFTFRYPTAGASEGIYKLMAEYLGHCRENGRMPEVHVFEGEYEGFVAYAAALGIHLVRHPRSAWQSVPDRISPGAQFWISQPSAIDGAVWPHFEPFVAALAERAPTVAVIPDLTYVGCVARTYTVTLDAPNVPAFVISQSKPFGGYYQRAGAVFARRESPSLFGNRWFKNLLSLAWATEMMRSHGVFDLPQRYRQVQQQAACNVSAALRIDGLAPTDVSVLAVAPLDRAPADYPPLLQSVLRGCAEERVLRLCLTPAMSALIDPALARATLARHPQLEPGP